MLQTHGSKSSESERRPSRRRYYGPPRSAIERSRFKGTSIEGVRIRLLRNQYKIELGDVCTVPAVAKAIHRAAELVIIAEMLRAAMIRGEAVNADQMLRYEGVAARAEDRMRALADKARAEAQSAQSYDQFFAFTRTGRVESREPHEAAGRGGATPSPRHAPGGRRRARQRASCNDEEG